MRKRQPFDPARLSHSPKAEVDFIGALAALQGDVTDSEFASRLNVSEGLWRHTKDGSHKLGFKLWSAAAEMVSYRLAEAARDSIIARPRKLPERRKQAAA